MVASQNLIGRLVDPPIALAALRRLLQETGVGWLTLVRYSLILPFLSASDSLASRPLIMRAVERRELTTDL